MNPPYSQAAFVPPPPPMPTLTVNNKGTLYLHTSLRERLGLRHGDPINLVPPTYGSLYWHLDLRPAANGRVVWHDGTGVRVYGVKLPPGLVSDSLVLHLLPGEPPYENVYPLLPDNAFTP